MDNFSVRSERNFHNLVVKPNHMHLLDKPNGYASAMVKSSLSHQMRLTVQKLEEELCAAGNPHVLQIKLLGDDSREPSSWKLFADGMCVADGSGAFVMDAIGQGMIQACKTWGDHDAFADIAEAIVLSKAAFDIKERACQTLSYIAWTVGRFHAQHLIEGMVAAGVNPMLEDLLSAPRRLIECSIDKDASTITAWGVLALYRPQPIPSARLQSQTATGTIHPHTRGDGHRRTPQPRYS